MGVHAAATRGCKPRAASAQFSYPPGAGTPEGAEIARALAVKLGCARAGLIGCLRASIVRALNPPLEVVGIDDEPVVAQARQVESRGAWSVFAGGEALLATATRETLRDSLLVVNARLVLSDDAFVLALGALLAEVPAAVVIDPDGGLGMEAVSSLVRAAQRGGLTVEHRSLLRSPEHSDVRRQSPLVVLGGRNPLVGSVIAAGPRRFALYPHVDLEARLGRPVRVCVASYEVAGPTQTGGIGTANTSLALALAQSGHDVTLLFTGLPGSGGSVDARRWERYYARQAVQFEALGDTRIGAVVMAPHANVRRAYEFYTWLRERDSAEPFEIVHFPECQGHAYYAVLARRQGIAFADTLFVAGVHSSTRWCAEANRELPRSIDALVDEHLERLSVELADVVISPSAYMLDYMQERGWKLPDRRFVQQYILPSTARIRPGVTSRRRERAIEEIVFFGRLEVRKGIETFCDALDRVAHAISVPELRITFLGRPEHVLGEPAIDYIARRAACWPWKHRVLGDLDRQQAMAYLRRTACVAVMPSTVDNSPNTVSEALSLRIPVIASRSGGTGELIEPLDLPEATFPGVEPEHVLPPVPAELIAREPSAAALAERILAAISSPIVPRFSIDHDANEQIHVGWNRGAAAAQRRTEPRDQSMLPTVTVGILHRDQTDGLLRTLAAASAQSDQLVDLIVVDDASNTHAGLRQITSAEELCERHGWKLIRRARRHAAAAREQMIAEGHGQLVVFLRSSESLSPNALAILRSVARRTGADVLTWPTSDPYLHYRETSLEPDDEPAASPARAPVILPVGGPPLAGLIYPAFSTGPYAITRAALDRLRGFAQDARGLEADQDLLNRALLRGCSLAVIPEPLTIAEEADSWSRVRRALTIELGEYALDREQAIRIARPFAAIAPSPLLDLPGLQLTLQAKGPGERSRARAAYKQLDDTRHQQAEYIAYLEAEHRTLSAQIHALQEAGERAPRQHARRAVARLKRRLRGRAA